MTFVIVIRWIVAAVLALFWLGSSISNLVALINARIHRSPTSLVLFFGGIAGVVAMLACPIPGTNRWAWVPAVLDLGCIPAGLAILVAALAGKFKDIQNERKMEPTKPSPATSWSARERAVLSDTRSARRSEQSNEKACHNNH